MDALPPPQRATPASKPDEPGGRFCPNCGAPILPHETACKYCGEQLAPFFAPLVGRARRGGMERGLLFGLLGCGGVGVLATVGLVVLFVSALFAQGGNNENGYACSPGPCALASPLGMKVTRVVGGTLPAGVSDASSRHYLGFVIHVDVSGTATVTVSPDDFGLVNKDGTPLRHVAGFSGCPTWNELPVAGDSVQIPTVCYAVPETNITDYRMTWSRLKPGQRITLYLPKSG